VIVMKKQRDCHEKAAWMDNKPCVKKSRDLKKIRMFVNISSPISQVWTSAPRESSST
jgi:hypothetical protein